MSPIQYCNMDRRITGRYNYVGSVRIHSNFCQSVNQYRYLASLRSLWYRGIFDNGIGILRPLVCKLTCTLSHWVVAMCMAVRPPANRLRSGAPYSPDTGSHPYRRHVIEEPRLKLFGFHQSRPRRRRAFDIWESIGPPAFLRRINIRCTIRSPYRTDLLVTRECWDAPPGGAWTFTVR